MTRTELKRLVALFFVTVFAGACVGGYFWFRNHTAPLPTGAPFYVRYEKSTPIDTVLADMQRRGVIRDPQAAKFAAILARNYGPVSKGTYQVRPGMRVDEMLTALHRAISQRVRIPETNWAARTARLLETKYSVTTSKEYMSLVDDPAAFSADVSFPLPLRSLEGYLFPDTYDLPPLLGARQTILRQLRAFDLKVWQGLNRPNDLQRIITIASLVEMETGTDADRPMIAGVISNRLKKNMRLQIDATILYGMGKWRRLTFADYKNQTNPYNTYLIDGLPPGPICSPSLKSIQAAMHPAEHDYLYYVALPNGSSLFAETYEEHKQNIKTRKRAMEAAEKAKAR